MNMFLIDFPAVDDEVSSATEALFIPEVNKIIDKIPKINFILIVLEFDVHFKCRRLVLVALQLPVSNQLAHNVDT